jgi:hypothetical protein
MHHFPGYVDIFVIVCPGQHLRACKYILDLYLCKGPLYVLINKARLAMGKNPNSVISFSFRRIIFLLLNSSRVSPFQPLPPWLMRVDRN